MPKNITNAYYPHFSAIDDSTYTGDTLVSNGKIADFEDEDICGQSSMDLTLLSSLDLNRIASCATSKDDDCKDNYEDDHTHDSTTETGYVSPDGSNTGTTEPATDYESSDSGSVSLRSTIREKLKRSKATPVKAQTVFRKEDF